MSIFGQYRLVSGDVYPGESPQDELILIRQVGADAGTATVSTPFKEGTTVGYCVLYGGTIDEDGNLVADTAGDAEIGLLVFGKSQAQQTATSII